MRTALAEARSVDAGEGAQRVVAEEVRELRFAIDALMRRVRKNSENI